MKKLLALITTVIVTEVATKITGLKRFNEIQETHIFNNERRMEIIVKYLDYHVDANGNKFEVVNNFYKIVPNPDNLPLTIPKIEDPNNAGQFIDDVNAVLFDPLTDEYFIWLNDATGQSIAGSTISRLQSINGVAV